MYCQIGSIRAALTAALILGSACSPGGSPTAIHPEPTANPGLTGKLLFVSHYGLTIFELGESGELLPRWADLPGDMANFVEIPAVSPDRRLVVLPGKDRADRVIVDLFTGKIAGDFELQSLPGEAQFSLKNSHLAYTDWNSLYVYHLKTQVTELIASVPCSAYTSGSTGAESTICGDIDLIGWLDDQTLVYSAFTGRMPEILQGGRSAIEADRTFVTDASGSILQDYPRGLAGSASSYGMLATSGQSGSCETTGVGELRKGTFEVRSTFDGDCPHLSPTGRRAFSLSDGFWVFMDLEQGITKTGRAEIDSCLPAWSPDEEHIACQSGDELRIFELADFTEVSSHNVTGRMLLTWIPAEPEGGVAAGASEPTPVADDQAPQPAESGAQGPATDLISASSELNGEMLQITLGLQDLPPELMLDRAGVEECSIEYEWGARVDLDDDASTGGRGGYEYAVSAHYVGRCEMWPGENPPTMLATGPTSKTWARVSIALWEIHKDGNRGYRDGSNAVSEGTVDPQTNTVVLGARIPGITPASRLEYFAYDYFGGEETITP